MPSVHFVRLMNERGMPGIDIFDPISLQYAAFISIPPVVLFLLFRKWLTPEVWLGTIRKG
ncbi:hypothetical protein [Paenibacillus sp. L3-i20]|uniref:hypothetical protein n=1 Tax=Paenibacillus sp. L3-i20 TaxID=2905833 RepID=UPI0020C03EA6|nr:hypothetical protein [Paenibacillus sp. L3-i20]